MKLEKPNEKSVDSKTCCACKEVKVLTEFYQYKSGVNKGYYRHWCKKCANEYNKKNNERFNQRIIKWRELHKEELLKKVRQYYKIHRQERLEYNRKYHIEHKDKIREKDKNKYIKNREQIREYGKRYRKEHKDIIKKYKENNKERFIHLYAARRARKNNAEGSHTLNEWLLLKKQYNYTCPCCGRKEPEIKLTKDHIIPLVKGGSDYINNIQPLCKNCNSSKYTQIKRFINSLEVNNG